MIGYFKSLREAIRTGAVNFVKTQSELMKASEKPSCTVRTQRSDQDSSRPLLARGKTAISRFYRASVPVGVGPSLDRLVLADLPQAFRPGHSPFAALPELVAGLPGHPPVLLPQLSTLHLIGEVAEEAMARLVEAAPFVQTLHITGEISLHALRPAALPAWPSLADVGVVLTRLPPQQIGARPFLSGRRLTRLIICESDLGATINREQFGSSLPSEVSGALAAMVERPDTCSIGLPCADVPHAGFLPAA